MHISLCAVGLQWHKMNRKCPEHPSSSLLTTAAEEKQTSHRLLFLFFLVFSGHDMNEFDRFDCRLCCDSCAGIFKWIFDHFLSGYRTCFNMWLPCTIHILPSVSYEMPHFMQFSVPANKSCTLAYVLLDCNGTIWTGNAQSIPAAAYHNSCWGETNFPQVAISFLFGLFRPWYEWSLTDLIVDLKCLYLQ